MSENKDTKIFTPGFSAVLASVAIGTLAGGNIARNAIDSDPVKANSPSPVTHEVPGHHIIVDVVPVEYKIPVEVNK